MNEHILEVLEENECMVYPNFEDALIGYTTSFGATRAVYDRDKCILLLMFNDGMTRDEAEECFQYNTEGGYLGENMPVIVQLG